MHWFVIDAISMRRAIDAPTLVVVPLVDWLLLVLCANDAEAPNTPPKPTLNPFVLDDDFELASMYSEDDAQRFMLDMVVDSGWTEIT